MQTRHLKSQNDVLNGKQWARINKVPIAIIFGGYLSVLVVIGLSNYPYIDDTVRQITGMTNFAAHYSRWISEIGSWIVQGSRHLTDQGITTFVLSATVLSLTSILALYLLYPEKKVPLAASVMSIFIGINPWFLECISFRFDGPFIAMSLFFAFSGYLLYRKNTPLLILSVSFSVFLMCNTYQASSGIAIVVPLVLSYQALLDGARLSEVLRKLCYSAIGFILGMIIYLLETKLNSALSTRGDTTEIVRFSQMPMKILENTGAYFNEIIQNSAKIWLLMAAFVLIGFIIYSLKVSKLTLSKTLVYLVVFLVVASVLSYGVLLVFETALVQKNGRYGGYGLSVLLALLGCLSVSQLKASKFYFIQSVLLVWFMFYQFSFSFGYGYLLANQKDTMEYQTQMIAQDLKGIVTNERFTIFSNALYDESPVVLNAQRNYPILKKLIPDINNTYWPNEFYLHNLTGLNVRLAPERYDFTNFPEHDPSIITITKNSLYNIYINENQIFIERK